MLRNLMLVNCLWILYNCTQKPQSTLVIQKKINETVYASGNIESSNQYQVVGLVSGYIKKITISEGDKVFKNQTILEIANEGGKIALKNAELNRDFSNIYQNKNKIKELKIALNTAKSKWLNDSIQLKRKKKLVENNIITSSEYESFEIVSLVSKSNYESTSLQLEDLLKQLKLNDELGKGNYAQSSKLYNDYTIKSEVNGIVYSILKKTGELVTPQTPIAIIGGEKNYVLKLQVDEYDITKIQLHQKVKIKLDSYRGDVFNAYITKISPIMNEKSKTFTIEAQFEKQPPVLYPNLTVEANIIIKTNPKALLIPREFLFNERYVFKKDGVKIRIKTGIKDLKYVEVLAGLKNNEEIIVPNEK